MQRATARRLTRPIRDSQLLQEHERVEALRVAKEKADSNKIKDLQVQVSRLKEKLVEQQEVAERTKPFDENIVFRSEVHPPTCAPTGSPITCCPLSEIGR